VMREVEVEGVVAAVEGSGAAEASVVDSVGDSEEEGADSEETGEDSVVAAGPEEQEADLEEVGEDSVEATTEEKAVLNSTTLHHHKFSNYQKVFHFCNRIG